MGDNTARTAAGVGATGAGLGAAALGSQSGHSSHGQSGYDSTNPTSRNQAGYESQPRGQGYESTSHGQPGYETSSSQPGYDSTSRSQPGYDSTSRSQPGYDSTSRSQPGYDSHDSKNRHGAATTAAGVAAGTGAGVAAGTHGKHNSQYPQSEDYGNSSSKGYNDPTSKYDTSTTSGKIKDKLDPHSHDVSHGQQGYDTSRSHAGHDSTSRGQTGYESTPREYDSTGRTQPGYDTSRTNPQYDGTESHGRSAGTAAGVGAGTGALAGAGVGAGHHHHGQTSQQYPQSGAYDQTSSRGYNDPTSKYDTSSASGKVKDKLDPNSRELAQGQGYETSRSQNAYGTPGQGNQEYDTTGRTPQSYGTSGGYNDPTSKYDTSTTSGKIKNKVDPNSHDTYGTATGAGVGAGVGAGAGAYNSDRTLGKEYGAGRTGYGSSERDYDNDLSSSIPGGYPERDVKSASGVGYDSTSGNYNQSQSRGGATTTIGEAAHYAGAGVLAAGATAAAGAAALGSAAYNAVAGGNNDRTTTEGYNSNSGRTGAYDSSRTGDNYGTTGVDSTSRQTGTGAAGQTYGSGNATTGGQEELNRGLADTSGFSGAAVSKSAQPGYTSGQSGSHPDEYGSRQGYSDSSRQAYPDASQGGVAGAGAGAGAEYGARQAYPDSQRRTTSGQEPTYSSNSGAQSGYSDPSARQGGYSDSSSHAQRDPKTGQYTSGLTSEHKPGHSYGPQGELPSRTGGSYGTGSDKLDDGKLQRSGVDYSSAAPGAAAGAAAGYGASKLGSGHHQDPSYGSGKDSKYDQQPPSKYDTNTFTGKVKDKLDPNSRKVDSYDSSKYGAQDSTSRGYGQEPTSRGYDSTSSNKYGSEAPNARGGNYDSTYDSGKTSGYGAADEGYSHQQGRRGEQSPTLKYSDRQEPVQSSRLDDQGKYSGAGVAAGTGAGVAAGAAAGHHQHGLGHDSSAYGSRNAADSNIPITKGEEYLSEKEKARVNEHFQEVNKNLQPGQSQVAAVAVVPLTEEQLAHATPRSHKAVSPDSSETSRTGAQQSGTHNVRT